MKKLNCSLTENNSSWEDVIAGFSLENMLTDEQEALLDKLIKYLDKEYKDVFK